MIESISLNGVNAKQQYKYERRSRTKTGTSLSFSMQMPTILCILRVVLCVLWINEINYNSNFNNYIDNSNDSFGVYGFVIRNSNIHSNKNVNINSDFFSQFRNAPTQRTSTRTPTADKKASPKPSRTKLLMGQKGGSKGDKQNRKPRNNSGASTSSSAATTPALPRVSNQINVPIRRQIRYGKINKQLREAAATGQGFRQTKKGNFVPTTGPNSGGYNSGGPKRTAYRKVLDEATVQQKALERQKKGRNPDWSVVLNQTKADPLVMVDGYNVIYKWARLKKHMVRGDTQHARELLLEDLEGLASLRRWRIECVFDGAGRGAIASPLGGNSDGKNHQSSGKNPTTTPFGKTGSVRTVYTGSGVEADTYIEGRCAAAKNVTLGKITSSLIVATDDAQIRLVANSAGALCMGSDRFVLELRAVKKSMQHRVETAMAEVNGVAMRPEKLWGTSLGSTGMSMSSSGVSGASSASTGSEFVRAGRSKNPSATNSNNNKLTVTANSTATATHKQQSQQQQSLRPVSATNRIGSAKKVVVREHADGSKIIKARYGAHEIVITDNRNKKPRARKKTAVVVSSSSNANGNEGEGRRKKKRKKKKKK